MHHYLDKLDTTPWCKKIVYLLKKIKME